MVPWGHRNHAPGYFARSGAQTPNCPAWEYHMDTKTRLQLIDQAFSPAREIEIPELFSGRRAEIVQGLYAMRSQGASICIYGGRGVGKSSIAKQLRLVASGLSTLTDLIERPELFDTDIFPMPSVYFYCDDTIKDWVPLLSVRSHAARVSSWSLISEELESSIPYNLRRSD